MNTIQLQEDITFKQYEIAVRVFGDIGIKVSKDKITEKKIFSN